MIEITAHTTSGDKKLDNRKNARSTRAKEASFDQVLSGVVEKETERGIESLMNDLRDQERRFLDSQSLYELQKYKTMLQKILKMVVGESYKTATIDRRRRDRADYLIVNKISEKMDELARIFATSENKAFSLMKTLEEIRGLLCDLVY
ncbi:MAG TPA: DUF327 family protein [Spirochaetota bacterium]